jgi:predicted nucleic acid-binding protein
MTTSTATRCGVVLIDASARSRYRSPVAAARLSAFEATNTVATCPIVTLELLYSARSKHEFAQVELSESQTRPIQLTRSIVQAAIGALRTLSEESDGYHRVKITDALIAATAQEAGADVVHYDRHFDRLSQVLRFNSIWLAPAGTLT